MQRDSKGFSLKKIDDGVGYESVKDSINMRSKIRNQFLSRMRSTITTLNGFQKSETHKSSK